MAGEGVDLDKLLRDIGASANTRTPTTTGGTVSVGSSGKDIDALAKIVAGANATIQAQRAVQINAQQTDKAIVEAQGNLLSGAAQQMVEASGAKARAAETATSAALKTQQENIALKQAEGLDSNDPASVLRRSIAEINSRYDSAKVNLDNAYKMQQTTIGAVLRGNATFQDWYAAKFTHPQSGYEEAAATDLQAAKIEQERIAALQGIYSGQAAVNKSAEASLTTGSAADAAKIAAADLALHATELQNKALVAGSGYLAKVMANAQHAQSTALGKGNMEINAETSMRQWAKLDLNTVAPEQQAKYVQIAMKFFGRQDADTWTPERLKSAGTNEQSKAYLNTLADIGSQMYGQAAADPTAPMPQLFTSPGEASLVTEKFNGKLPQGMETLQLQLSKLSAGTDADPMTKKVFKPAERIALINGNVSQWLSNVSRDLDATPEYGKVHLASVTSMNSMRTPEVKEFTDKVLIPLSKQDTVPMQMIVDATVSSDLPENVKIAGLVAYGRSAAALVDATRRPQVLGLPSASGMGYTATVSSGSLFGGHKSVNFSDEKSVRDFLFRKSMFEKAKKNSLTPIDAVAGTIITSMGDK